MTPEIALSAVATSEDGERIDFAPGDALFVPAGIEHRFVDFSDGFAAWVVFWGPPGGEAPV